MPTKQKNYRFPDVTTHKIDRLTELTGATEVQVLMLAIDRMNEEELKAALERLKKQKRG